MLVAYQDPWRQMKDLWRQTCADVQATIRNDRTNTNCTMSNQVTQRKGEFDARHSPTAQLYSHPAQADITSRVGEGGIFELRLHGPSDARRLC
jgi:hypothetical protein